MSVYIYNDLGASKESVKHTVYAVSSFLPGHKIVLMDSTDLLRGDWVNDASLLVMPGGRDVFYARKLNGAGNEIISEYVENGGSYLGICAGSYYASKFIEFDKGGELEIVEARELAFFAGKAIGPVLAPYNYENNSGARAVMLSVRLPGFTEEPFDVYYNGGGYFSCNKLENAGSYLDTEVIATYEANGLPAILKINFGKGVVLLSAVHFEYAAELLNRTDENHMRILPFLQGNQHNVELCHYIFKGLLRV
jgi:glutamine amidotransferase-like uncharacterized protein